MWPVLWCCAGLLLSLPVAAQQQISQGAWIDGKCLRHATTFQIPPGWVGSNLQVSWNPHGAPCMGPNPPQALGYRVEGPATFTEGFSYADSSTWGGHPSSLAAGNYRIVITNGGRNDSVSLFYTLVNPAYEQWRAYLEQTYAFTAQQSQQAQTWWNQEKAKLDRWYTQSCIPGSKKQYCDSEYNKAMSNLNQALEEQYEQVVTSNYGAAVAFNQAMDKLGLAGSKVQLPQTPRGGTPPPATGQDCSRCACNGYVPPACALCCLP